MLLKLVKFFIGIALIPVCVAATRTAFSLLAAVRPDSASALSAPVWGFLIGFGLWIFLFFAMPHPARTYIFAHEMTHAIWAFLMGARISGMKIDKNGGSVSVTKSSFLIALAPYCFPFYSMLVLLIYATISAFTNLNVYKPFWMGMLGLTWSFHLTFTVRMLREHQTDISSQGRLFGYTFIYLINILWVCVLVVAMGSPTLKMFLSYLTNETIDDFQFWIRWFREAVDFLADKLQ